MICAEDEMEPWAMIADGIMVLDADTPVGTLAKKPL